MSISKSGFVVVVICLIFVGVSVSQRLPQCEVCTDVLTSVMKNAKSGSEVKQDDVKDALLTYCKKVAGDAKNPAVGDDGKRAKFCFYIGAHAQSATSIINKVTEPLAFHKPPEKVCDGLINVDSQICELKFDKPIDWATIDLSSMRVKQLKELLAKLKGDCKGCTEKSEYIDRINELKPKKEL